MIKLTNELIIEIEGYGNIVVHEDTTLYDLIKRLNKTDDIIACSINNEIVELSYKLKEDTKLKLISIRLLNRQKKQYINHTNPRDSQS